MLRLALPLSLVLAAFAPPFTAGGQDAAPPPAADPDFERALEAVQRGEIIRLSDILPGIELQFSGRAIDIEIETDDGRWVYELEILTTDGRLFEVDVDAVSGDIIDVEEEVD